MITIQYILDIYGADLSPHFQKGLKDALEKFATNSRANETKALEEINTHMWKTWGVKSEPFGRNEGEKIMQILNDLEIKNDVREQLNTPQ